MVWSKRFVYNRVSSSHQVKLGAYVYVHVHVLAPSLSFSCFQSRTLTHRALSTSLRALMFLGSCCLSHLNAPRGQFSQRHFGWRKVYIMSNDANGLDHVAQCIINSVYPFPIKPLYTEGKSRAYDDAFLIRRFSMSFRQSIRGPQAGGPYGTVAIALERSCHYRYNTIAFHTYSLTGFHEKRVTHGQDSKFVHAKTGLFSKYI